MRSRVDYRFLRAVTNPVTGDEATIGVLHWDGNALRFAHALRSVPQDLRGDVQRLLTTVTDRVNQMPAGQRDLLKQDLIQLFPVPEGRGSLIHWGKPVSGLCSSGEQHFTQLVAAAGLSLSTKDSQVSKTTLRSWISDAAQRLHKLDPDRVQLDMSSPGHIPFQAPLAWKNGVWNFALPWSFDTSREMEDQIRDLVGQLATGLDDKAKAAVVFFAPGSSRNSVLHELSYVQQRIPGTRVSELQNRDGQPDTRDFEAMVQTDVAGRPLLNTR